MADGLKVGERVQVTFYGETRTGTVTRVGRGGGVVWVQCVGRPEQWFHAASVTRVGGAA